MNDPKNVLKTAWEKREGPAIFTTVDKQGVPNAVYASGVKMLEDGSIVIADNYFNKTKANIKSGSKGSVLFITKERTSFQAKGSIEYLTSGPIYEDMRQWVPQKHPRGGVAIIRVEELYAGAEKLL